MRASKAQLKQTVDARPNSRSANSLQTWNHLRLTPQSLLLFSLDLPLIRPGRTTTTRCTVIMTCRRDDTRLYELDHLR